MGRRRSGCGSGREATSSRPLSTSQNPVTNPVTKPRHKPCHKTLSQTPSQNPVTNPVTKPCHKPPSQNPVTNPVTKPVTKPCHKTPSHASWHSPQVFTSLQPVPKADPLAPHPSAAEWYFDKGAQKIATHCATCHLALGTRPSLLLLLPLHARATLHPQPWATHNHGSPLAAGS